ncbi:2-amino-4-hydroxy-6-hydroxymethyldihydropteridine diphosphokinase [Dongia mobilis]|uniref:2-amino-4-hydroxy-6-hydroxymethyldihydropteridine pyrophosphokinase n=1 Tax=Dongia mobilis TaxID=578943 RepID=A0A4R6WUD6_9PROT|nr:2-amino-4-hydroxy-6-hydroxymethyldihydropteridine diphosphokinase [Dongia mobilis]TDQ82530.1 2-amino-4-hydroxy-6-hydroxymethyldihydropteridine diphosphokinase [Dongia mobilis]
MKADPVAAIYLGLGANLPSRFGTPVETLERAVAAIAAAGIAITGRSPWYESAPVPRADDQPWYVNGVVRVATELAPAELLAVLQGIEREFGRVRSVANAPRTLDLDIIAYGDRVANTGAPLLPHPRMQERAFVLLPLRDLAPGWRHPVSGRPIAELIAALGRLDDPQGQEIRPLRP